MEELNNKIETMLSNLLKTLSNEDYQSLISDNPLLKKYDSIMQKIDNGGDQKYYLKEMTPEELKEIIKYLKEKTT